MARQLLKSTGQVSSMTLLSRLLGFVRDMIFAHVFGAMAGFDAFLLAFKLPNFMRALFAEGAFSQAFVPVLAQYQQLQPAARVRDFLNRMLGALLCAVILLTLVVVCAAPWVVHLFAPGFDPSGERFLLASHLLRITFPYLILITTAAFFAAILNTYKRFLLPAFVPCLLNVSLIAAALWGASRWSPAVNALAWGVIAGGVLQACMQMPALHRIQCLPRPQWFWRDAGVRRVVKLMLPAVFGVSVAQISILISTIFASYLMVGSLSWLYYSERIIYLPVGVFGVAIATVVLPHLSQRAAHDDTSGYVGCVRWGIRLVWLLAVPAALGIAALSAPLLMSLFHYGAFSSHDALMAERSLLAYSVGLPAFMLVKVLAAAFYARQDIKTPVKVALCSVVLGVVLNAVLIGPLAHAGLALATSISSWFNALALLYIAKRQHGLHLTLRSSRWACQCLLAATVMALVIVWLCPGYQLWSTWPWWHRGRDLCFYIMLGACIYTAILWCCGVRWRHLNQEVVS